MNQPALLTTRQAAELLAVSESFFRKHIGKKIGKVILTPRCVRYRVSDIEKYAEDCKGGINDKV